MKPSSMLRASQTNQTKNGTYTKLIDTEKTHSSMSNLISRPNNALSAIKVAYGKVTNIGTNNIGKTFNSIQLPALTRAQKEIARHEKCRIIVTARIIETYSAAVGEDNIQLFISELKPHSFEKIYDCVYSRNEQKANHKYDLPLHSLEDFISIPEMKSIVKALTSPYSSLALRNILTPQIPKGRSLAEGDIDLSTFISLKNVIASLYSLKKKWSESITMTKELKSSNNSTYNSFTEELNRLVQNRTEKINYIQHLVEKMQTNMPENNYTPEQINNEAARLRVEEFDDAYQILTDIHTRLSLERSKSFST